MTFKEFWNGMKSGFLFKNLIAMVVVVILLIVGTLMGISLYTRHGESIIVPKLEGKQINDAEYLLERDNLQLVVSDSGYNKKMPPGCILSQFPVAGSHVKDGRVIYVVINATASPTIPLPDIADNSSLREAEVKLKIMGFKLGAVEYIDGEKDWVYSVKAGGKNVFAGDRVAINLPIILIVGNGHTNVVDSLNVPEETEDAEGDVYYDDNGSPLPEDKALSHPDPKQPTE